MPARACRGCLATGPRLYNIYQNNLNEFFGDLVGNPISEADDLPQHFCGMCFAQLTKYISFRNRCRLAQDILQDLKLQGMKLSTRFIKQIDRSKCNLVTNLEIVTPINCDLLIQEEFSDDLLPETQDEPVSDQEIQPLSPKFLDEVHENISQFPKTEASDWFTPVSSPRVDGALLKVGVQGSSIPSPSSNPEPTWLASESTMVGKRTNRALSSVTEDANQVHKMKYGDLEIIEEFKKKYNMDVTFLTIEQQIEEVKEKIRKSSTKVDAGPYCSDCGKSYLLETNLEKHKKECHDESAGLDECEICRYRLPTRQLERHLQTHKIRIRCRLCDFTTKNFGTAMDHARDHGVTGEPVMYSCKYCEAVFGNREWLNSHIFRDHSSKLPWCKFCGETVLNKTGMRNHMRCHEDLVKSEYRCLHCGLTFVTSEALDKHSSLTCVESNCVMCGDHFESKMLLKEHLIQQHPKLKYIKLAHCEGCGVKFFGSEPLENHLEDNTCGSGHPCQVCGSSFSTEQTLEDHKTGSHVKQYQACESCDKAFDSKNYQQHILRVHNTKPTSIRRGIHHTSDKAWSEEDSVISGVATSELPEQGNDEKSKTILVCDVCGKTFLRYVHAQTEVDKPFRCDTCFKGPTRKESLESHTGTRRHICRICGKKFRTSSGVKAHIKAVHMHIHVRTLRTLRSEQGHMDAKDQMDTQDQIDGDAQENIDSEIQTQSHIDNDDTENLMDYENTENEVTTQYYMDSEIETQDNMDSEVQTQVCIDAKTQSVVKIIPVNIPGKQKMIRVENKDSDHTESYIDTQTQYYMDNGVTQSSSDIDTLDAAIAVPRITKTIHIKRRRKQARNIPTQNSNENTHSQGYMDTHKQIYIDSDTGNQVYIENEAETHNHIDNDKNTQSYIENDTITNIYMNDENAYSQIDNEIQAQDYILTEETNCEVVEASEQDYIDTHTQDYTDNDIIQETVTDDYDTHNRVDATTPVQRITKTIHIKRRKKQTDSNIATEPKDNNTQTQEYMDTHTQDYMDGDLTQVGLFHNQDNTKDVVDTPVRRITKTIHIKHRRKRTAK